MTFDVIPNLSLVPIFGQTVWAKMDGKKKHQPKVYAARFLGMVEDCFGKKGFRIQDLKALGGQGLKTVNTIVIKNPVVSLMSSTLVDEEDSEGSESAIGVGEELNNDLTGSAVGAGEEHNNEPDVDDGMGRGRQVKKAPIRLDNYVGEKKKMKSDFAKRLQARAFLIRGTNILDHMGHQ